ncbi:hypothetical protein C8J56DRAFT_964748 [Mycena floridula]|nr:hypothetical protein C8J56DRAFT_964748 [Mycena floridula]
MSERQTVDDLPNELLEHIFLYADSDHSVCSQRSDAPYNLGAVCSRWRDVAHSIPSLWASFKVVLSESSSTPPVPVVEAWLCRSGAFSLTLALIYEPESIDSSSNSGLYDPSGVLQLLISHISHWESVYLDLHHLPVQSRPNRFQDQAFSAPALLSLQLHLPNSQGFRQLSWLNKILAAAPVLSSFTSYNPVVGITPPWSQLTSLRLESSEPGNYLIVDILHFAPALLECDFTFGQAYSSPVFNGNAFTHNLQVLKLRSPNAPLYIWPRYTFPDLIHLEILQTESGGNFNDSTGFIECLSRSACPITHLTFRNLGMSNATLLESLLLLSNSLTHLHLHMARRIPQTQLTKEALDQLTFKGSSSILCPWLESIIVHNTVDAEDGSLSFMVKSRYLRTSPYIAKLSLFVVEFSRDEHREDLQQLHALYRKGLRGNAKVSRWCAVIKASKRRGDVAKVALGEHAALLPKSNWSLGNRI